MRLATVSFQSINALDTLRLAASAFGRNVEKAAPARLRSAGANAGTKRRVAEWICRARSRRSAKDVSDCALGGEALDCSYDTVNS